MGCINAPGHLYVIILKKLCIRSQEYVQHVAQNLKKEADTAILVIDMKHFGVAVISPNALILKNDFAPSRAE